MVAIMGTSACAPSTFDNLTGGPAEAKKENAGGPHAADPLPVDPTLAAPRPIAPISVSWVNTNRPKFRWELKEGSTGAVIELSRTRDFKGEIRRVVGNGTEAVLTEEQKLEPGFWFWRLRGHNLNADGAVKPEKEAPVWEFLVRGPSANKASDAPQGAIVDMNGDGEPDLVVSVEVKNPEYPTFGPPTWFGQKTLLGSPTNHTFTIDDGSTRDFELYGPNADYSLTGGTDLDGDGYPELVRTMLTSGEDPNGEKHGWFVYEVGSAEGLDYQRSEELSFGLPVPDFSTKAIVQASGDLNGDGYGDFTTILPTTGFTSLGSVWGPVRVMFFMPFFEVPTPTTPAPFCAGGDLDGDGLTDIVMASRSQASPIGYTKGSRDRFEAPASLTMNGVTPLKASSLTTGDFYGNATAQIAFATQIKDAGGVAHGAVCIYATDGKPLEDQHCWKSADAAVDTFGLSIVAGDLDGDGRDDLIVGSASGLVALSLKKDGSPGFDEKVIAPAGAFRPQITMIHPGLHTSTSDGAARWAAIAADGKSITVFRGHDSAQKIPFDTRADVVGLGNVIR